MHMQQLPGITKLFRKMAGFPQLDVQRLHDRKPPNSELANPTLTSHNAVAFGGLPCGQGKLATVTAVSLSTF